MSSLDNPYFLLHASVEFLETGIKYASDYFKLDKEGHLPSFDNKIAAKLTVPATTISFALELAFKGLLKFEKKPSWGHDLKDLFESLEIETQIAIIELYKHSKEYEKFVSIKLSQNSGKHGEKIYQRNNKPLEIYIRDILAENSDAFVKYRYLHEFNDKNEWVFPFKEMSRLTLSAIKKLAEYQGVKIQMKKKGE